MAASRTSTKRQTSLFPNDMRSRCVGRPSNRRVCWSRSWRSTGRVTGRSSKTDSGCGTSRHRTSSTPTRKVTSDTYEWTGYIPFDQLPASFDPPEGFIVSANNAVTRPGVGPFLAREWAYGTRAQRIVDMIQEAGTSISPDDVRAMLGVVATDNGLVAVGTAGRINDRYLSVDAAVWLSSSGHTWRRMHDPELKGYHQEVMRDVAAVGDLLIAVGEASNYPAYWPQPLPDAQSTGVVWISEDHGATWHRMDDHDRVFGSYLADWITLRSVATSGSQLVAAGYDGEGVAVWTGTIDKGD